MLPMLDVKPNCYLSIIQFIHTPISCMLSMLDVKLTGKKFLSIIHPCIPPFLACNIHS